MEKRQLQVGVSPGCAEEAGAFYLRQRIRFSRLNVDVKG